MQRAIKQCGHVIVMLLDNWKLLGTCDIVILYFMHLITIYNESYMIMNIAWSEKNLA